MFVNNKPFSSLQGNELALFIVNIPVINEFIKTMFEETEVIRGIMHALTLWQSMFTFLGKTRLHDCGGSNWYSKMIEIYISNANEFLEIGAKSFLSDGIKIGPKETFYVHELRNYIPVFAKMTLERHGLGIGIFNMQGFECQNIETKNTLRRFSNMKGNIVINIDNKELLFLFTLYEILQQQLRRFTINI